MEQKGPGTKAAEMEGQRDIDHHLKWQRGKSQTLKPTPQHKRQLIEAGHYLTGGDNIQPPSRSALPGPAKVMELK